MKCICKNCTQVVNNTIWTETENKYQIKIRQDIQQFLTANSGGFPIKAGHCPRQQGGQADPV